MQLTEIFSIETDENNIVLKERTVSKEGKEYFKSRYYPTFKQAYQRFLTLTEDLKPIEKFFTPNEVESILGRFAYDNNISDKKLKEFKERYL